MLKSAAAIKNIYFTVLRVGRPIFRNSVGEIGRTVTQAGVNGYVVALCNNCSRYSACTEIERRVLARAVRRDASECLDRVRQCGHARACRFRTVGRRGIVPAAQR